MQLAASWWPEEFVQRYEAHGLALLHTNEADWAQRTNEHGLRRPTHAYQIFFCRAFDLWSQMGLMYQATVSVTQFMIPDEILWRIAVYWPDLGNHWHEESWQLHPGDDSRSASCLPDLIHSTYVLVVPGLLNEMAHRPHGLLEVTQPCSSNGAAPKDQSAYPARVPQGILSAWMAYGAVRWHPQSSPND